MKNELLARAQGRLERIGIDGAESRRVAYVALEELLPILDLYDSFRWYQAKANRQTGSERHRIRRAEDRAIARRECVDFNQALSDLWEKLDVSEG